MSALQVAVTTELDTSEILRVLSSLRRGDFSVKLPEHWTGTAGKIADTLNDIIDTNQTMTNEIRRVSRTVGKDGKISCRIPLEKTTGAWAKTIDDVNDLIGDLTRPTAEMVRVIGAVAKGDLSQSVTIEMEGKQLKGEFLQAARTVNAMVDQLGVFTSEVTRVAREVGTDGKLGGQAKSKGLFGSWKDLTDSVNSMAGNLTGQVRNISEVTIAVAGGDLSRKITVDVRGEFLQLKEAINTMVDQLRSFASEVTRVAREVGTDGKLGGQAIVPGVAGVWKDLTDNVNSMAGNLTGQVRNIATVTTAVANGDLSKKITVDAKGEILELKNTVNIMVDQLNSFASEVTRVAREVGTDGKLGGQAEVKGVGGTWKDLTDSVNFMAGNLTNQVRNIATVTTAVANGDLTKKITVDARGEILEVKNTVNIMVDQLNAFASEVTRVAREVATDGKLGGQAEVKGVAGTWKDLTDSVNYMAGNLTDQVRNIATVTTAVANGDLTRKITVDAKGEILELKDTINTMVDQLNAFASEVTRVAREVGTDGKLGGQAEVKGVGGTWKDLTDNVNSMAGNLTNQVRNIATVTTAVANGDLTSKITVDAKGEILELKDTINTMVDQLNAFASEVTRVAREVGTDGKLGGQAEVKGVAGVWKDLTDNVNFMAGNLTNQVRNIATVTTAVANGDLAKKITVDAKGEIFELKDTINTMVDQLNSFASEVTRVAREVGTDGKLGGQATVPGVAGVWKDLTDNVNSMAGNLTNQVRNIATVTTAVANGDLAKKITVDAKGEIFELKDTINIMVDQLNSFASEVTRVAREVGTDGKLGGQATVPGVAGVWKDLTDNVNSMAGNLTNQVRNIAEVTTAVANGDLAKKITVDAKGEILELKSTVNIMVDQLSSFAAEVTRVAREVGTDGKLGGQAEVKGVGGVWKDLTDSVNFMAGNLTSQVRNIAEVTTAVANGDLAKKITVDARGEILEVKNTVNTMVDQLNAFASEVTRVAREVGTDGKLGGQADVKGVGGTWKDLTDSVNFMAGNLTIQVRNIAEVTTAVANGDLAKKITVDARGEILEVKNTVNTMVDQLNAFASEVTRVAREVGTDGKLGGQADVKGVGGTWKDLTDSVNFMAGNLTNQVRNIAEVTTSVAKGDLTRKITVDAKGEILELKSTINIMVDQLNSFAAEVTRVTREVGEAGKLGGQAVVAGVAGVWKDLTESINEMIRNLNETTQRNTEQDWLKTNLANFSRMLQGQRDLITVSKTLLSELAPLVNAQHGVFFVSETLESVDEEPSLRLVASYAFAERKNISGVIKFGEGIIGQSAFEKEKILLTNVPHDYIKISSGLGEAVPLNIIALPVLFEDNVKAVIELASFEKFSGIHQTFLDQLSEMVGIVLNTIAANTRTEALLKQSQSLAQELQSGQQELQQTNLELQEKAKMLTDQKAEVEQKNLEVEQAKRALEDKAEQLALTSKYKSQFLANMSHELRTPLNSLLILSQQLAENPKGNLDDKDVEYSRTIHASGTDLLNLINDILDLSKIESGTVTVDVADMYFTSIKESIDRTFTHMAERKGLKFAIELSPHLPIRIRTDENRLQQILKNLLSNAFKFTGQGTVKLSVNTALKGWNKENEFLNKASSVIAFSVSDTGIGIAPDKQRIIFEAFQQADGTTSRRFGGTGLGLSISREIAHLLGGEIHLASTPEQGSTFTLYLPLEYLQQTTQRVTDVVTITTAEPIVTPTPVKEKRHPALPPPVADDRESIAGSDRVLLIIEDDPVFAQILLDLAREKGFKCIIAADGDSALTLAAEYQPHAITLDMILPEPDGWQVLETLKQDPETRHIPVHVITGDDQKERGLSKGAVAYFVKPVDKSVLEEALAGIESFLGRSKKLLIVIGNEEERIKTVGLLTADDVTVVAVVSGEEALEHMRREEFDCMVLDLKLPGMSGLQLLEEMRNEEPLTHIPVMIHGEKTLTRKEESAIKKFSRDFIIRDIKSAERLLDETALFLHRIATDLPEEKRQVLENLHRGDGALVGKKVLVVDDDVRNIFALTTLLERHQITVLFSENGKDALEKLKNNRDVDLVLMDIMMPEMDGYETTQAIRRMSRFKKLPIIALTAKAMLGDREKCIESGASDYITKPVDSDKLISLIRVWLYQ